MFCKSYCPASVATPETFHNLLSEIGSAYYGRKRKQHGLDGQLQYGDFAAWQQESLASSESAQGRQYWKRQRVKLNASLPFGVRRAGR